MEIISHGKSVDQNINARAYTYRVHSNIVDSRVEKQKN